MPELFDWIMPSAYCRACDGRRRIGIVFLENQQEWWCETGKHVLIYDKNGKEYIRTEYPKEKENWRASIDRQRTEGYVPQKKAWEPELDGQQRQRRKKNGKYNYYIVEKKED